MSKQDVLDAGVLISLSLQLEDVIAWQMSVLRADERLEDNAVDELVAAGYVTLAQSSTMSEPEKFLLSEKGLARALELLK